MHDNLIGKIFHYLTVLEILPSTPETPIRAKCQCKCGKIHIVSKSNLLGTAKRGGGVKSCGCWNDEQRKVRAHALLKGKIKYTPDIASAKELYNQRYAEGDIPFNKFLILSKQNCTYCKIPPQQVINCHSRDKRASKETIKQGNYIYNGLDRVDSSKPHNLDNVVPCCKICNRAKSNMPLKDFLAWIEKINNNQPNKDLCPHVTTWN